MPCYHEIPTVLMSAINSACDADYPASCLHLFVSFDGADVDELYLSTLASLGVVLPLKTYPVSIDLAYRGVRITVSRFAHGGKRHCQKKSFRLIDKMYESYLRTRDDLFILFIDSDIILDKVCVQNFVHEMEIKSRDQKQQSQPMLAMTGIITCTAEKRTLLTILQDIEYVHGQLYERTVESACGAVTCLPGALTMLRFSAFRNMAKYYFAESAEHAEDMFDFGKSHLGEDRWLTHLFMLGARNRFQIQLCTGAFCKTEAVLTYRTLLKQRRRWFLGFITNEACMLTDIRLWKMYPLLCVVRMMQNTIRTTALLLFIMTLSVATGTQKFSQLPYSMIIVTLGLNWGLMFVVGLRLHRYKSWLYPVMYICNPALNWAYMVYGIFTAGQRTWGGPRADKGDDLEQGEVSDKDYVHEPVKFDMSGNAVVNAAAAVDTAGELALVRRKRISVQPDDSVVGKFALPQPLVVYEDEDGDEDEDAIKGQSTDETEQRRPSASALHGTSTVDSVYNLDELYCRPRRPEKAKRRLLPWDTEYSDADFKREKSVDESSSSSERRLSVYEIQPLSSHPSISSFPQSSMNSPTISSSEISSFSDRHPSACRPPPIFTDSRNSWARSRPQSTSSAQADSRSEFQGYNIAWRRVTIGDTGISSPLTPRFEPSARQALWLDSQRQFFGMDDEAGSGEGRTWF